MGRRGPVPLPSAVAELRGNPGKRPLNRREPKARAVAPKCPEHVRQDAVAYKEWRRLVPILLRMRVLSEADGLILANLCLVHSHLMLNLEKMRQFNQQSKSGLAGMIVQTKSGYVALNQIYGNVQSCMEQQLKLCRELGLRPSSRSRIQTPPAEETATGSGLLNGQWRRSG